MDKINFNIKKMDAFFKALKDTKLRLRVGIIGDGTAREDGKSSNAEIGIAHEFGTDTLPQRSWLRAPMQKNFFPNIQNSRLADKEILNRVLLEASFFPYMEKLAIIAEETIQEAFDTGFDWKPSDMSRKKNHQTLVETQQLRRAIHAKVIRGRK